MEEINNTNTKRLKIFDIAKGIAIILVVYGHCGNYINFTFLIHMLFFFVVSGYFFKDKYSLSISSITAFIKKKFTRLLAVYICLNAIFACLHNWLIKIHIYGLANINNVQYYNNIVNYYYSFKDGLTSFFTHVEPLIHPAWFLIVLFLISVIYVLISHISLKFKNNKELIRFIFVLFFLQVGYWLYLKGIRTVYIGTVLSCISAYYIGHLFSKYKIIIKYNFSVFVVCLICLLIFDVVLKRRIVIAVNEYYNPGLLILLSILSFVFIMSIASFILNKSKMIPNVLTYIGQNTMPIMLFHLLGFKFINYIQIIIYKEQIENLVPRCNHQDFYWVIIYTITGVILPIIINNIYTSLGKMAKTLVVSVKRGGSI